MRMRMMTMTFTRPLFTNSELLSSDPVSSPKRQKWLDETTRNLSWRCASASPHSLWIAPSLCLSQREGSAGLHLWLLGTHVLLYDIESFPFLSLVMCFYSIVFCGISFSHSSQRWTRITNVMTVYGRVCDCYQFIFPRYFGCASTYSVFVFAREINERARAACSLLPSHSLWMSPLACCFWIRSAEENGVR